jgi:hypothetical protein
MVSCLINRLQGRDISFLKDEELIRSVGVFFGEDFSDVRFCTGGVLPFVVPFPYSAVVIHETINIREGYEHVLSDPHVMAEELFHVIQWRSLGWTRLPPLYLFYHLTQGYRTNPIEREAKRRADAFIAHLNNGAGATA